MIVNERKAFPRIYPAFPRPAATSSRRFSWKISHNDFFHAEAPGGPRRIGRDPRPPSVEEMPKGREAFLHHGKHERSRQARGMTGRTTFPAFLKGRPGDVHLKTAKKAV